MKPNRTSQFVMAVGMSLILTNILSSQPNSYFLNNPVWEISKLCAIPYPCVETDQYFLYVQGDTIIDGVEYVKLFKAGVISLVYMDNGPVGNCYGSETYSSSSPAYYLRSENKRIFYKEAVGAEEALLYDFNLSVGDTLPQNIINPWSTITINDIDSIEIAGTTLRRFHLSGDVTVEHIVEGIGSLNGLFSQLPIGFDCGYQLLCYGQNDSTYYPVVGPGCMLPTNTGIQSAQPQIEIFPNPMTQMTNIDLKNLTGMVQIEVYSAAGHLVRNVHTRANGQIQLQREEMKPGMYFLKISQQNNLLHFQKLLVSGY